MAAAVSPNSSVSEAKGGHKAVIENIIITNSRIEDNAGTATPQYLSLYVGGVVGDITSSFGGYNNITSNGYGTVTINNIYCEVDIDLPNVIRRSGTSDNQKNQYNVGGIAARMRKGKYADIPTSCVYRGQINAPLATIAPVFGFARCNGSHSASLMTDAYLWEVLEDDKSGSTWVSVNSSSFTHNGETYDPNEERYFSDYSIYDTSTSSYVTITDAYPVANSTRNGVRTLDERDASSITHDYQDATTLRAWQGVNHGTYIDLNTGDGRTKIAEMLSKNSNDPSVTFAWNAAGDDMYFSMPDTVILSRPTLHTVYAELPNYRSATTYLYCWTITKIDGTSQQVTVSSNTDTQTLYGYTVTPSLGGCTILLPDECNNYKSITLDVQNAKGTSLCSDEIETEEISVFLQYYIATVTQNGEEVKDHYVFQPYYYVNGVRYAYNDPLFANVTCTWEIEKNGSFVSLSSSGYEAQDSEENGTVVHIKSDYVGTIRLTVNDIEINSSSPYTLLATTQVVQPFHLAVTMMEYDPTTGTYSTFKPSDYFSDSTGYGLLDSEKGYKLTTSGTQIIRTASGDQYLASDNIHGTLNDTKIKPIIFKAEIVDQFGDKWKDVDLATGKWRIQWSYKLPGEGTKVISLPQGAVLRKGTVIPAGSEWDDGSILTTDKVIEDDRYVLQKSITLSDSIVDPERSSAIYSITEGYNLLNGSFDTSASDYGLPYEVKGSLTDWVGDYWRVHGTSDTNFSTDRWGEYQIDSLATRLIIHPNLLHRTSAFWVRARLYSVEVDTEAKYPGEEIIEFNQLAIDFDKTRDAEGNITNYTAKIVWRGTGSDGTKSIYGSSSDCTYTWYSSSDPSDPNSWTFVKQHKNIAGVRDRLDQLVHEGEEALDPTLYYKIEFLTSSGTFLSDIVGPVNVVFVYNRDLTISNAEKCTNFDTYNAATSEYFPNGHDMNNGHDPENAVKTMERAFEILDSYADGGRRDNNKIVIMGYYQDQEFLYDANKAGKDYNASDRLYAKPVTLSGAHGAYISGGTWGLKRHVGDNASGTNQYDDALFLSAQAPMTWENLDLYAVDPSAGDKYSCFYCYNHDFTVGKGVRIVHFNTLAISGGLPDGTRVVNFSLVGGRFNDNHDMRVDEENSLSYEGNEVDGITTIKIYSGAFGRVMPCARNDGDTNWTAHNIFGTPWNPSHVRLTIDIQHENDDLSEFMPTITNPTHDIGIVVGGQTDGSAYADVVIDLKNAKIARYAAGNITYGRSTGEYTLENKTRKYPTDSFFGSTVLNMYGGQIGQLYGGCLGRHGTGDWVRGFLYGRSIINMYGGTIGGATDDLSLYASGAGCVTGIGRDWGYAGMEEDDIDTKKRSYTPDPAIPYYLTDSNGNKTLEYGSFEIIMDPAQGNTHEIPSMEIYDHDGKPILVEDANGNKVNYTLNLQDTYVEVNLYGGTVYGDIYGGGYGYSNQFTQNQFQWAPRRELYDGRYRCLAGTLYGNATINLLPNPYGDAPVTVYGNIYGGGAGALEFLTNKLDNNDKTADIIEYEKGLRTYGGTTYDFNHLAQVFGDVSINIEDGVVMGGVYNNKERGNVFGGGMGKNGFPSMGNIYGNCSVTISGGEIQGNVYGGSAYSDIQKYSLTRMVDEKTFNTNYDQGGNTSVNISGGTFGNCIFGGGLGCLAGDNQVETSSNIEGNTSVIITGGRFSSEAYTYYYDADGNQLTDTDGNPVRTQNNFNIYGGGYINGVIDGNAEVMIKTGLLYDEESLGDGWTFEKAWNDITYRRFCVYGGGWGENTLVEGNANIRLDIPEDGKVAPTDQAITELVPGQTFFDVAGGGYAGDVGYWVDEHNVKSLNTPAAERVPDTFAKYQNGNLLVTVSGYPFVRKVVGGGFYSQCNNADTYIFGGSIQEVYGGALMGYVHKNARLYIGQPNTNMNEWELTRYNFSRHTNLSDEELASVNADRRENAYKRNHSLFIVGNVYGGNDVKGVVGSTKWYDKYLPDYSDDEIAKINAGGTTKFGMESSDDEPLFCSDVEAVDTKGVTMTINGGTICGNVYGVGNGHYRGYYVPGWARYGDGPARQYRKALLPGKTHADYKVNADGTDNADQVYGNVYRCRPMTGKVTIHISGNGLDDQGRMDSVSIRGNVYGGGRACTLGQWNTALPYEDPRRLTKGGFLHINMGSNVNIGGSVYMGSEGTEFATAHEVPSDIDLSTFDGSTTEELDKLGDVAYDHWYYDATDKYYKPGFPAADQVGGNIGIYGEHMYRAYFKNIEMQGDVEITFYNDPFEKDANGYVKTHDTDGDEYFVRRRWVPGEMAISDYDATNVTINSFYGGGACGSMTNNTQMYWNYDKNSIISDPDNQGTDNVEKYGAIYRYILPPGVTILDRIVGGSENATNRYYGYTDDTFTKLRTSADSSPIYEFEGGMVTQSTYTYYLLAYNDQKGQNIHDVKPEVYLKDTYDENDTDPNYTLSDGTLIYPKYYETGLKTVPNALYLLNPRFAIAVAKGQNGATDTGYCGAREERSDKTVLKLTVANQFDPQEGEHDYLGSVEDPTEHYYHFGGVIYGGCYDSGVTQGDVMVSVLSNTIGRHLSEKDPTTFGDISTLEHNIGRVFGGGYGADSRVDGDTYVNLMHNFVGMNVFGGGCQGDVNGMTHIKYVGDEANSFVFGAIYGGGLYGNVGVKLGSNNPDHDPTPIATEVRLFSGNVDKVYGGACLGDLYGRTHVELCDEVYGKLEYFNYELLLKYMDVDDWGGARLIAGTVFGGNDVSGNIYPQPTAGEALNKDEVENNNAKPDYGLNEYSTYVKVHEIVQQPTQGPSSAPALSEEVNPGKESPGASNGYNGFPLIGDLYGGSNGSYGSHSGLDYYEGGTYRLASGLGNYVIEFDLAPDPIENYTGFQVPHVEKAYLDIQGGTLINVYGGGDKATITGETNLNVNYSPTDSIMRARAGFAGSDALLRIWNTFHLSDEEQIEEVTTTTGTGDDTTTIFNYHIYRIFGGNDNADMAIQPTWNLVSGYLGSVYSGGNFGKMTYCEDTKNTLTYTDANGDPQNQYTDSNGKAWDVPELKALKLQINSPTLHADAVFGGGRVGDIEPALATTLKSLFTGMTEEDAKTLATNYLTYNPNFYGATLEINDGVVDHVYGGNDVSGTVYQGSRVKITGAISGDVYCAGNGNYRYQYDYTNNTDGAKIAEAYDSENYGGRYFILPMRTEKDGSEYVYGGSTNPTPTQILQAINAYRPNVERTYLTIEGTGPEYGKDSEGKDIVTKEAVQAFVRGNVYCGGNSSTVNHSDATDTNGDIKFEIGSYVVLNGVFLGSNGESLVDPEMMEVTERLNGIDLTEACDLEDYPALLDLYMQAVEITGLPKDFNLSPTLTEAYIGDFYVGGNNGSMLTDKTIGLTFPYNLVIYNRIVGGSNSANVTYRGTTHIGGLTPPLSTDYTDKVYLQVRSQFKPLKIKYVDDVDNRSISLVPDLDYDGSNIYFPEGKCSIFGGCYNSGRTVGNIHIDLYSDMVKEWDTSSFSDYIEDLKQEATNMGFDKIDWANIDVDALLSKDRVIVNGIDQLQRRSFALIGGGYGSATEVRGDIKLHMLPGKLHPDFSASNGDDETPSAATIFGGSQQGSVIGNTEIAVRDGMVLSNLYGGSEAAPMYGSTQILIGWPQYYICKETGHYQLTRTDDLSKAQNWKNSDDPKKKDAILHDIWLREGEYVSVNLYKTLTATTQEYITDFTGNIADYFTFKDDDTPQEFAGHYSSDYVTLNPINWDDIDIYIGNGRSRKNNRQEEYFAHGNVYGGGFITSTSTTSLAGEFTVCKFTEDNCLDPADVGYGGNSSIMVWDNVENRNPKNTDTALYDEYDFEGTGATKGSGAVIRDHITIGTGHYVEATVSKGMDIMGKYLFEPDDAEGRAYLEVTSGNKYASYDKYVYNEKTHEYTKDENGTYVRGNYVHQSSHILTNDDYYDSKGNVLSDGLGYETFYEIESDGGIYGGGRKVYVEGFRNCDLAYYGYADYCPQYPKLLNTAQRLDLFTVTDCCCFFEGASDFSTTTVDATSYSLTRIGELKMISSIPWTSILDPGTRQTTGLYNTEHLTKRSRNYIAFFHDVLYVAALTSNEDFTNPYRGANGKFYYTGDYALETYDEDGNLVTDTRAHNRSDVPDGSDYVDLPTYEAADAPLATGSFSYMEYKKNRIENYYANRNKSQTGNDASIKALTTLEFNQRNVATAANMIGINNGYTLKIQGLGNNPSTSNNEIYYGPVTGVFEVKLMTLATDEGGGYIYALNQHDDPNHFLETTGNFVFPGAAYNIGKKEYNYIYDDCFPMGEGWEEYYGWDTSDVNFKTKSMGPRGISYSSTGQSRASVVTVDTDHGDCNELEEVHYWYVNGSNYYFNVTLTGVTYNNPRSFTLSNNDLIYLYGVPEFPDVDLVEVYWEPISKDGYSSDLQDLTKDEDSNYVKDYKLYLSVDKNSGDVHDGNMKEEDCLGYMAMLPRANYPNLEGGTPLDVLATSTGEISGQYKSTVTDNKPLLGITLCDSVNNAGSNYYQNHLSEDEHVRIVLKAKTADSSTYSFQYTINLTIRYILGPTIKGVPKIENCALPGEYIYANADDIVVEIADNLAVTERNWYVANANIYNHDENRIENGVKTINSNTGIGDNIECITDQIINGDMNQVHIPAYLYRDGWDVVCEIVANSIPFYRTPYSTSVTDEEVTLALDDTQDTEAPVTPETPVTTEDTEIKHLVVHNYHRMKPYDGTSRNDDGTVKLEDLRLTAGARIYIENQPDFEYFFHWLADSCKLVSDGRTNPRVVASGERINPEYGDSLFVYLMTDVKMPDASKIPDVSTLTFRGTFHGNGHSIDLGENHKQFLGNNEGHFYNTGFITSRSDVNVFCANSSTNGKGITSCFLYNESKDATLGRLVALDSNGNSANGNIYNSFRTSSQASTTEVDNLWQATKDDFEYGKVAYNLNHFYLKKRYNLATNSADGDVVEPVNAYYRDGNYRFAEYSAVYDADKPWVLRSDSVPNYHAIKGERISHHHGDYVDNTRWNETAKEYQPNFPQDFIFFGQDLAYRSSEDQWPHAIAQTKRVYRASGFYGSKLDQGFHFNTDAAAVQSTLTAIDFAGYRDQLTDGDGRMGTTNDYGLDASVKYYTDYNCASVDRNIWYAPALDLPDKLESFTTSTYEQTSAPALGENDYVTRNLLVYRPAGMDVFNRYIDTSVKAIDIYYHVIDGFSTSTDSEGTVTTAAGTANTDLFQLVDMEDFNCPIEFGINQTVWYRRKPEVFSSGSNAWEGLCLPFTVRTVYGSVAEMNSPLNHGEMTHFYGYDNATLQKNGLDVKADSHEYWLRKFIGVTTDNDKTFAIFTRPASTEDTNEAEETRNYHYSNTYFSTLYGDSYWKEHDVIQAPGYTEKGIDFTDYPMITAQYPYIISFPGKRYYEFDCSGEFYAMKTSSVVEAQTITYAWNKADVPSTDPVTEQTRTILVSDDNSPIAFKHDDYEHLGTYMHYKANTNPKDVVIDTDPTANSSTFVWAKDTDTPIVYPFRTYLRKPDSGSKTIYIASRGIDSIGEGDDEEDGDSQESNILFSIESNELVIDNPHDVDFEFGLYDLNGRYLRSVTAQPGVTRVASLSPGYYLISTFKFRIN